MKETVYGRVTDEMREDAEGVFTNTDKSALGLDLTRDEVAVSAFRIVFSDIAQAQTAHLNFSSVRDE